MLTGIIVVSGIGLLVCVYAAFIEHKLKTNRYYKPACDISDKVSCTKVFLNPSARVFIANAYIGMLFYTGMILLGFLDQHKLAFIGATAACAVSLFLAYILYTKVKAACLNCISIYIINAILLYITYRGL